MPHLGRGGEPPDDHVTITRIELVIIGRLRGQFPVMGYEFPDTPIKFPVPILREFVANLLI